MFFTSAIHVYTSDVSLDSSHILCMICLIQFCLVGDYIDRVFVYDNSAVIHAIGLIVVVKLILARSVAKYAIISITCANSMANCIITS